MKRFLFLPSVALLLATCSGSDPADYSQQSSYNPAIHTLQSVILDGAQTLALKERETRAGQRSTQGIAETCDELGRLDGVNYSQLETKGQGGSIVLCFKNIQFWDSQTIYGQYRPDNSTDSVWFITDATGKVHHFPNAPKKGSGFKNGKRIGKYQGKPLFLNPNSYLATLNMETGEEETLINTPVGRFVVIPKNNGDHIVYKDLSGGKIRRPDNSVENIPEINSYNFYYKNPSGDLTYTGSGGIGGGGFKNMIMDASGNILERAASSIPIAYQEWLETIGVPAPTVPWYSGSMETCERSDNLMICESPYSGVKGFILADSSQDMMEINWFSLGIYGDNPRACLTESFIYVAMGNQITQINKNLSASEPVLTDFQTYTLTCLNDNNLIMHGFNEINFQYETFQLTGNIRTMITENISAFIRR